MSCRRTRPLGPLRISHSPSIRKKVDMKLLQRSLAAVCLIAVLHPVAHAQSQLFTKIDCSQLYKPGNDPCDPILVSDSGCFPFNTFCASDYYLPATCGDITRSTFFEWQPATNGTYYLDTCGQTSVDTILVVYTAWPCTFSPLELDCSNDQCGRQSRVVIEVTNAPSEVFTIRVGSRSGTSDGTGSLCIRKEGSPAQEGMIFATCFAGPANQPNASGFVLGLIDTRIPPIPGAPVPVVDTNWKAPMFHNESGSPEHVWNAGNLGQVFGITLDAASPPNVYVSSTTVYGDMTPWPYPTGGFGPGGPGAVYRIDGVNGEISTLLQTGPPGWTSVQAIGTNLLPNDMVKGPALGDVCYDRDHDQFFVSNLEDGSIYRVSPAGLVLSVFDPFGPDDGLPGFAPLGERVWAVQKRCCSLPSAPGMVGVLQNNAQDPNCRSLFFSVWQRDDAHQFHPGIGPAVDGNSVWRIEIDASGEFGGQPTLVTVLPAYNIPGPATWSSPVSDIAFSGDRMLLAERRMRDDYGFAAHSARVLEYKLEWDPSELVWTFERLIYVGEYGVQKNCAGGVDYDPDQNVWASGDALHFATGDYIYGVQRIPKKGNSGLSTTESYLIDLDADTSFASALVNKGLVGDVESVSKVCGTQPPFPVPPPFLRKYSSLRQSWDLEASLSKAP